MLRWVFTADTAPYRRGLAQMRTETKAFTGSVTRMFAGVFGGAAIASAFGGWFRQMDRLGKAAKKLGADVEDLQRASLVAEKGAVSTQQLTNLLVRLKRRFGEAAQGSATYQKRLEALGLSQEQLQNAQPTDFIIALSRAWQTASTSGTGYADLLGLLDTEARELIPILKEGPEALAREFQKASVVTSETIANVEKMNDRLADLKNQAAAGFGFVFNVIGSIGDSLGAQLGFLIGLVAGLWRSLKDGAEGALKVINGILKLNGKEVKEGALEMGDAMSENFKNIVNEAKAAAMETGDSWAKTFGFMKDEIAEVTNQAARMNAELGIGSGTIPSSGVFRKDTLLDPDSDRGPTEGRGEYSLRKRREKTAADRELQEFADSLDGVFGPSARERQRRREMLEFSRRNGLRTELDPDPEPAQASTPSPLTVSGLRSIGGITAAGVGASTRSYQAQSVSLLSQIAHNTRPRDGEGGPPTRPPRG